MNGGGERREGRHIRQAGGEAHSARHRNRSRKPASGGNRMNGANHHQPPKRKPTGVKVRAGRSTAATEQRQQTPARAMATQPRRGKHTHPTQQGNGLNKAPCKGTGKHEPRAPRTMTGKQLTLTTTNLHLSNAYARPTHGGVVTLSDETPQAVMALQSLTMGKIAAVKRLPGRRLGYCGETPQNC